MAIGSKLERSTSRRRHPGLLGWLVRLVMTAGLVGAATLVGGFFVFAGHLERDEVAAAPTAEGVVALTGGAERIADAVTLLARGNARRLLITGVNPTTSAGEIARLTPEARRYIHCCIDLGYRAENTIGNAAETSRWVRDHAIRSLIVVTSNYHMPRALAEIGHAAPGVELFAYPVVTDEARATDLWSDNRRLRLVMWEYLKFVVVKARLALAPQIAAPPA